MSTTAHAVMVLYSGIPRPAEASQKKLMVVCQLPLPHAAPVYDNAICIEGCERVKIGSGVWTEREREREREREN